MSVPMPPAPGTAPPPGGPTPAGHPLEPGQQAAVRSIGDTPVRTEKISERVAREIVRDVAAAGVTVGVKLPSEPEMCDRYGVGRGSLREALRILEVQGLISIKAGPGGGPTVAGMSSERLGATAALHLQFAGATLLSVAEARVVLEPVLARQAAVQADRAIVARLTHLSAAPSTGNFERDLRMSGAFHTEVARASGNPVLALLGD
ncbi:MAG: FadR family transcriptional regulator, partial [Gordonia polyisoprenivorans]|nr:FadR family transcriptional regulator [Gordonia polyisoprenivorans]